MTGVLQPKTAREGTACDTDCLFWDAAPGALCRNTTLLPPSTSLLDPAVAAANQTPLATVCLIALLYCLHDPVVLR